LKERYLKDLIFNKLKRHFRKKKEKCNCLGLLDKIRSIYFSNYFIFFI
jgi:hypothetical protein